MAEEKLDGPGAASTALHVLRLCFRFPVFAVFVLSRRVVARTPDFHPRNRNELLHYFFEGRASWMMDDRRRSRVSCCLPYRTVQHIVLIGEYTAHS